MLLRRWGWRNWLSKHFGIFSRDSYASARRPLSAFELLESRRVLATLTVTTLSDSAAHSGTSLRDAVNAASSGDNIQFVSTLSGAIDVSPANGGQGVISINKSLLIQVAFGNSIIVQGGTTTSDSNSQVFSISTGVTVTLDHLTIAYGFAALGGGIANQGTLTLSNSTLSGNSSSSKGGGIYNKGTLTISNSSILDNTASVRGGGIFNIGKLTLSNSTLSGNSVASDAGGGLYDASNQTTITNTNFLQNTAPQGGGIFALTSQNISGSTFNENIGTNHGGALYHYSFGSVTIANSTFTNNTSTFGGVIYNLGGTATISNSVLSGNTATQGGGVYNRGTSSITGSAITGNSASGIGGGIHSSGTLSLLNSTVANNTAGNNGGGLWNNSVSTLLNVTLAGNSASQGGGIFNISVGGSLTLANTLVSGNSAASGMEIKNNLGAVTSNAHNLFGHNGENTFQALDGFSPGVNDINATSNGTNPTPLASLLDPGGLQDHGGSTQTIALSTNSPAIDAGNDTLAINAGLTSDQRGAPLVRIFGDHVDIGAYEAHFPLIVDQPIDEQDGDFSAGDLSLREAIQLANASIGADFITFGPGLIGTISLAGSELTITDDVTITGPGAASLTISGNNLSRILNISESTATVTISNLTIAGGTSTKGGGITNQGNLYLSSSTLSGNTANNGGGLYSSPTGTVTINNSTLTGNIATGSGGGAILNNGFLYISGSTISGNTAPVKGGGIYERGSSTIDNTIFSN
ncbi:MAG: hypothetical protein KDB03_27685, partial [Planctomycetales bacterium]|nr:hypothetical protein [Planctomycetales bacterium]